jgi:hypothetical protein
LALLLAEVTKAPSNDRTTPLGRKRCGKSSRVHFNPRQSQPLLEGGSGVGGGGGMEMMSISENL